MFLREVAEYSPVLSHNVVERIAAGSRPRARLYCRFGKEQSFDASESVQNGHQPWRIFFGRTNLDRNLFKINGLPQAITRTSC